METFINDRLAMFAWCLITSGMAIFGLFCCCKLIISPESSRLLLGLGAAMLVPNAYAIYSFVPKTIRAANDYIEG